MEPSEFASSTAAQEPSQHSLRHVNNDTPLNTSETGKSHTKTKQDFTGHSQKSVKDTWSELTIHCENILAYSKFYANMANPVPGTPSQLATMTDRIESMGKCINILKEQLVDEENEEDSVNKEEILEAARRKAKRATCTITTNPTVCDKVTVCASCQTTQSTQWRRGKNSKTMLCNPCGLLYAKAEQERKRIISEVVTSLPLPFPEQQRGIMPPVANFVLVDRRPSSSAARMRKPVHSQSWMARPTNSRLFSSATKQHHAPSAKRKVSPAWVDMKENCAVPNTTIHPASNLSMSGNYSHSSIAKSGMENNLTADWLNSPLLGDRSPSISTIHMPKNPLISFGDEPQARQPNTMQSLFTPSNVEPQQNFSFVQPSTAPIFNNVSMTDTLPHRPQQHQMESPHQENFFPPESLDPVSVQKEADEFLRMHFDQDVSFLESRMDDESNFAAPEHVNSPQILDYKESSQQLTQQRQELIAQMQSLATQAHLPNTPNNTAAMLHDHLSDGMVTAFPSNPFSFNVGLFNMSGQDMTPDDMLLGEDTDVAHHHHSWIPPNNFSIHK